MGSWDDAKRRRISESLLRAGRSSSDGVADAVIATWDRVDAALAPIVGPAGVAALYQHSLHLRASRHAALAAAADRSRRTLDAAPLRQLLAGLPPAEAAELGSDLLQTFHELLSGMVGDSLTDRLLRPVWAELSGDMPSEDDPS